MEANEYVERRLPKPEGFDEYCKNRFDVVVLVKRDEEIFTVEHGPRKLTRKLLRKNTNFSTLYRKAYVSVDVSNPNRIEQHNYLVEREIDPFTLKEKIFITLFNLAVLENNRVVEISRYEYGKTYQFGHRSVVAIGHYQDCYHYENNWLTHSPLSQIGLNYFTRYEMQYAYLQRHNLLQCRKRGMNNMFKDILGRSVDWRVMTKHRIKKYWINIAENDMDFDEFKAFLILLKNGVKLTHMNYDALPNINTQFVKSKHRGISIIRIMNYLYRQEKELTYYYDYLNTLSDIGVPAATDQTYFPKSLSTAHDDAVKILNAAKIKADERSIRRITKRLIDLEYEGFKYAVVAPKCLSDISQEGKNLDHCVGGSNYLNGHKKGDYAIMFVRLKNDKTKSLYTFTYQYNKSVTALHGFKNQDSKDPYYQEVKKFVYEEWLPWVKSIKQQPKQKKERVQPSQQMAMQG